MFKHCILTVGYSEEWENAFDLLPEIVERLGIQQLTLAFIVELHRRKRLEDSDEAIRGRLQKLQEQLSAKLGLPIELHIGHGFPASEVANLATRLKADGIIAINRSHSVTRDSFIGNVAVNLARVARVPLIVIPSDAEQRGCDSPLLFGTDGSEAAGDAEKVFERFLANTSKSYIVWVKGDHDDDHDEERVQPILHRFEETYGQVEARRITGDATEKLASFGEQEKVGLIIIGKRGSTPIADLMAGSTAEGLARKARNPLLIIP
jgi:nucleotide-binding universal stress UspA family protein